MSKPNPSKKRKAANSSSKNKLRFVLMFFALLLLICAVGLKLSLFKTYPMQGKEQKLSINYGETYSSYIDQLAVDKKVPFPIILKLYQRFFHDSMKAGIYSVKQGMSIRQVLDMIANAENAQMNRVLVIEGTTAKQLIAALKKDPLVSKVVTQQSHAQLLKQLNIPYDHVEGLFAPDTYFFDKGTSDQQILSDLYQRQMKILDAAWEKRDANLPYENKYQALIMASIIEKETSVDRELRQVSGVFVRRLKLGMRLQTDPTVIYGMGEQYKGKITREDLRTTTAYNTYRINGLPPTPIALPSKKAIEAAMHPDQSDAIYFVATGNGGHKFTSNLQDHNRAVQDYLAVIRAKKKE